VTGERTNERTNERTDERTHRPKIYLSPAYEIIQRQKLALGLIPIRSLMNLSTQFLGDDRLNLKIISNNQDKSLPQKPESLTWALALIILIKNGNQYFFSPLAFYLEIFKLKNGKK
jgi:hypothetical protein